MSSRAICVAIVSLFFVSPASQASAQSMPKALHDRLAKLVGNWDVETVVHGETIKWEYSAEWAPNKQAIIYHGKMPDRVTGKERLYTGIALWDGLKKVLVECGGFDDGSTLMATHHNFAGEQWNSPTVRTSVVDGKFVHGESLRVFSWNSDNEWMVSTSDSILDGKPQPKEVSTARRKR